MNKRQRQKIETYNNIIKSSILIFEEFGIQSSSIMQIAKKAGVAKGTIFFHIESKENLINIIIEKVYAEMSEFLLTKINSKKSFWEIVDSYLEYLSENERIIASIKRDFTSFKRERQRAILFKEAIIKEYFTEILKREDIESSDYGFILDIFFSYLDQILIKRDFYVEAASVIIMFKHKLVETFKKLLS